MLELDRLAPDERRLFWRRAMLAPLCLVLVAGLHAVRVWAVRQSPWKGGGFGMFSTVDSEANRFLRAYLVTDRGELPLPLPPALDKAVAELRCAPTEEGLKRLAIRLAAQQWRWTDVRQRRQAAAIAERSGEAIAAVHLLGAPGEAPKDTGDYGLVHALEPIPHDKPAADAVAFRAVRVECCRGKFDAAGATLRAELLAAVSVPRPEAQP